MKLGEIELAKLAALAAPLLARIWGGERVTAKTPRPVPKGRREQTAEECPVCGRTHFLRTVVCKLPDDKPPKLFQFFPAFAVLVAVLSLSFSGCAAVDGLYLSGVSGTVEREGERKTATVAVQFKPVQRRVPKNVVPLEKPAPTPTPASNL